MTTFIVYQSNTGEFAAAFESWKDAARCQDTCHKVFHQPFHIRQVLVDFETGRMKAA